MKNKQVSLLGVNFTQFNAPENTEEFNTAAKDVNACFVNADRHYTWHNWAPDVRGIFLELVEERLALGHILPRDEEGTITAGDEDKKAAREMIKASPYARKMKAGAAKADGTPGAEVYAETDKTYFERVLAQLDIDVAQFQAEYSDIIDLASKLVPYDPSVSARTGGEGRIAKTYLANAQRVFDLEEGTAKDGDGNALPARENQVAITVSKLEQLNPGLKVTLDPTTGKPTVEELARAIKVNEDRKRKEVPSDIL